MFQNDIKFPLRPNGLTSIDDKLINYLEACSNGNSDYWSFKGSTVREFSPAYSHYPAMMVPEMQQELVRSVINNQHGVRTVADPYMGASIVMSECMKRGLDFCGQDINPLAILIARTKSGPFFVGAINKKYYNLRWRVKKDRLSNIEIDFPGLDKWFKLEVQKGLSKLRLAIMDEPSLWARRFFWVAFAETIRLVSNSRTSTYKLHTRTIEEIKTRKINTLTIFFGIVERNIKLFNIQKKGLKERGRLTTTGFYKGRIKISLENSMKKIHSFEDDGFQLLVSSPSYGDNKTTVPYGQFSYLPLQWISWEDIDPKMDGSFLKSIAEIDSRSLGGSLKGALDDISELETISPSLKATLSLLLDAPRDRGLRVSAFIRDINMSLEKIMPTLNTNSYMIWTLGNRMVGGVLVPLDKIFEELLSHHGAVKVTKFAREISNKQMALKNRVSPTMLKETILIMRKDEDSLAGYT